MVALGNNKINVEPDDVDQFLKVWAADCAIMKRQPGFISGQLHRPTYGPCPGTVYPSPLPAKGTILDNQSSAAIMVSSAKSVEVLLHLPVEL